SSGWVRLRAWRRWVPSTRPAAGRPTAGRWRTSRQRSFPDGTHACQPLNGSDWSSGRSRGDLVKLRQGPPDLLFELGFDLVRLFQAHLAGQFRHHVGVDAVVPVAELDVDAARNPGVRLDDLPQAAGQLRLALGHVLAPDHGRLQRLEVDVDPRRLRQLGAEGALEVGAGS